MSSVAVIKPLAHESKIEVLRREVRRLAQAQGPGSKLPTVRAMAKGYRVNIGTLDRALRELEEDGVLQRRHGVGVFVSGQAALKTIALVYDRNIFDDLESPFPKMLVQATERCAYERQQQFHLYLDLPAHIRGLPGHEQFLVDLAAGRLDGVLYCGLIPRDTHERILAQRLPFVLHGFSDLSVPHGAGTDLVRLVELGLEALLARGCRRISLLTAYGERRPNYPGYSDIAAFERWMHTCPQQVAEPAIWPFAGEPVLESRLTDFGYASVKRFAARGALPCDGLLITNDMVARGVLKALAELGIAPGRGIQIATHANRHSPVLVLAPPGTLLLEFDPGEVAQTLLNLLHDLMVGPPPSAGVIRVPPVLRVQS